MQVDIVAYRGIGPENGNWITAEGALSYAMERCGIQFTGRPADTTREFQHMLVEWFYSGNWMPIEKEGDRGDKTDT